MHRGFCIDYFTFKNRAAVLSWAEINFSGRTLLSRNNIFYRESAAKKRYSYCPTENFKYKLLHLEVTLSLFHSDKVTSKVIYHLFFPGRTKQFVLQGLFNFYS